MQNVQSVCCPAILGVPDTSNITGVGRGANHTAQGCRHDTPGKGSHADISMGDRRRGVGAIHIWVINNTMGHIDLITKGYSPQKNSIFKDIVQKGGREVNPISKN